MIIRRLHIENFGCFHNFDLELEPGFNLLVRPNEAGKSTLLEFIRRIFWGFPDKRSKLNPYPALKGSGLYGGFLDVVMDDGTPLRLERYGERGKLKLLSSDGTAKLLPDISSFTGISEIFYRNVCAVTLDEVTAFAALDDPEIRNRLYGNALNSGSLSLSDLQEQLKNSAETIFKKRGPHNLLRQLATEFEASEKRLAEAASAMPSYEKAVLNAEKTEKEAALLKDEIARLQSEISTEEKKLKAAAARKKLKEDEELFSKRSSPAQFPEAPEPFADKTPELPQEPVLPPLPEEPAPPAFPELEGKCAASRAALITPGDLQEITIWVGERQKAQRPLFFIFLLSIFIVLFSAAFVLRSLNFPLSASLGAAGGALMFLIYLGCSFVKNCRHQSKLKKQKEDFLFRFAINPVVSDEELPELFTALKAYQTAGSEYEKELKLFEELKIKVERIRFEYELRRKEYDRRCAEYAERRAQFDQKRLSYEEEYRQAASELARYEGEKLALIKRRNELNELYGEMSAGETSPEILEGLREKLHTLEKALEEKMKISGAERREAALLLNGKDSAVELNVREQIRGRMRAAAERYLVLTAARICLERAVERSERERQPELLKKASFFMARLTQNAYTRVFKSARDNLLKISGEDEPEGKNISQLSRGTREQLFLALRMALIDSFEKGFESVPAVFDDILVNFDFRRRPSARQALEEFARGRQIIVFECQEL